VLAIYMIQTQQDAYSAARLRHEYLAQETEEARQLMETRGRELVRLQKVAHLAGLDYDPTEWRSDERDCTHHTNYERHVVHTLETATLLFVVAVSTLRDLKRKPHRVTYSVREFRLSSTPGELYNAHCNIIANFPDVPQEQKFRDWEEAERYARSVMERLEAKYYETLNYERQTFRLLKDAGIYYDNDEKKFVVPDQGETKG